MGTQTTLESIMTALVVFGLVIGTVFWVLFSGFSSNNITPDVELSSEFAQFNESLNADVDNVQEKTLDAGSGSFLSTSADVFIKAVNAITAMLGVPSTVITGISFLSKQFGFNALPPFAWGAILSLLLVGISFTIISAFWRYRT